jgi:hypothetical protein
MKLPLFVYTVSSSKLNHFDVLSAFPDMWRPMEKVPQAVTLCASGNRWDQGGIEGRPVADSFGIFSSSRD